MLDIHKPPPASDTKTYFSHSQLPAYIDPANTSAKKKPFATFLAHPHVHALDLVLPADLADAVRTYLASRPARVYARAWLTLRDVLEDDFLDAYIRAGGAGLLSEGADLQFQIRDGVLRIEMDRATYERAGIVGTPVEDGGKKHQKMRWRVEYDLKLASMKRGKKGFERLRWAASEVLGESKSWLFWSGNPGFAESLAEGREVLSAHAPEIFTLEPTVAEMEGVVVPLLDVQGGALSGLYDQEDALALLEWLDMLGLGSSRVRHGSHIDSHLCRYDVPDFGHGSETRDLVRLRWSGFITPAFVKDLFLDVWTAAYKGKRDAKRARADRDGDVAMDGAQDADAGKWFSMSAHAFGGKNAYSLMQFANRETLVWEVEA